MREESSHFFLFPVLVDTPTSFWGVIGACSDALTGMSSAGAVPWSGNANLNLDERDVEEAVCENVIVRMMKKEEESRTAYRKQLGSFEGRTFCFRNWYFQQRRETKSHIRLSQCRFCRENPQRRRNSYPKGRVSFFGTCSNWNVREQGARMKNARFCKKWCTEKGSGGRNRPTCLTAKRCQIGWRMVWRRRCSDLSEWAIKRREWRWRCNLNEKRDFCNVPDDVNDVGIAKGLGRILRLDYTIVFLRIRCCCFLGVACGIANVAGRKRMGWTDVFRHLIEVKKTNEKCWYTRRTCIQAKYWPTSSKERLAWL